MRPTFLGGLTPQSFMAECWQKKPLLVRGAFPDFEDLLTPDELAGLAMEEGVRSRLVTETGGKKPWRLETGPFTDERLRKLPRSRWSLLVQGVNEHLESAALLLDEFRFIPGWRLDDLMVSFAPDEGGVGPHVDSYDVFLLQGLGRRRWQIAESFDPRLTPGLDLKILQRFEAEQEWILEPGDMLYLPPGVAHNGVALEPCMTYSIGFRAPFSRTLVGSLLNLPDAVLPPESALYSDPDLAPVTQPGAVGNDAVARLRSMLQPLLADDELLGRWLGSAVTSQDVPYAWVPESGNEAMRRMTPKRRAVIEAQLLSSRELWRSDQFRFASRVGHGRFYVYVDAEEYGLPPAARRVAEMLLRQRRHDSKLLLAALPKDPEDRAEALAFLATLKAEGALYLKR